MTDSIPVQRHEIGTVTHYWGHLGVAGVHLTAALSVGDRIHIFGHTTDLEQTVGSLQIEHHDVQHADAGDDVGIRVAEHVREHDTVYKLSGDTDVGAGEHAL